MTRLLGFLLLALAASPAFAAPPYTVSIDRGLAPRMAPADVADRVMARLQQVAAADDAQEAAAIAQGAAPPSVSASPAIQAMSCVRGTDVERLVPTRMGPRPEALVWVVQADGDFRLRNPLGNEIRASQGYMVVDDATGLIVRVGSVAP